MRQLTSADILRVWEFGQGKSLVEQAIIALAPAFPKFSRTQLYQLPIGNRDLRLLSLRRALAGERLSGKSMCPECDAELQFALDISQLTMGDYRHQRPEVYRETFDDYTITFRPLNSRDQLAVSQIYNVDDAAQVMRRSCIVKASHAHNEVPVEALSETLLDAVGERVIELDPQVETRFSLTCAVCDTKFSAVFEAVEFVWCEIVALAANTLEEVVLLARAFGWSERDILQMTPRRRQRYLDMVPSS